MAAVLYLAVFLAAGVFIIRCLLPRHPFLNRIWLGLSLGLLLMMWLPALMAFALRFSIAAHLAALAPLAALCFLSWLGREQTKVRSWDAEEARQLRQSLWVCVPLILLSIWLQYTHVMRVDGSGNWNVGQSTYGDLPMHLSFITGLRNAAFPPDYPFYPGHQLSYPFLADSLSTSFLLLGCSLQAAVILPSVLMMALLYFGVMLLGREMTAGKKTIALAALLFFLNGGLGFLYDFDLAGGYEDGQLTILGRIEHILTGYYTTPTNQPDPNNLRWSNLICDLLVPQRTLLGGYCMLVPCLYLLFTAFTPGKQEERGGLRPELLLGVWGGALPLIHTHSFLALGLCSLGLLVYDMIFAEDRLGQLLRYLRYGVLAVALALPQLICFTFAQSLNGRGIAGLFEQLFLSDRELLARGIQPSHFLQFQFNWVNNRSGRGLRDLYLWFYVKNIGLPFIALLLALLEKNRRHRRIFAGAFAIILAAELIRFQPNEYDNNKLFYVAWLLSCMIVADWSAGLWRRLKGLRARPVIACGTAVAVFLSAGLTIWRECVSDYQAFDRHAVACASFIEENTEEHSVFLTGYQQHLNPVDSIAGRTVVCGPDLWLYWHGFDTTEAHQDIDSFYSDPQAHLDVLEKYGVDYIYVSSYERYNFGISTEVLDGLFDRVYDSGGYLIWAVPEG